MIVGIVFPAEHLDEAANIAYAAFGGTLAGATANFPQQLTNGYIGGTGPVIDHELELLMSKMHDYPWAIGFLWNENGLIDATQHWADGHYGEPWGWQQCLDRVGITIAAPL